MHMVGAKLHLIVGAAMIERLVIEEDSVLDIFVILIFLIFLQCTFFVAGGAICHGVGECVGEAQKVSGIRHRCFGCSV